MENICLKISNPYEKFKSKPVQQKSEILYYHVANDLKQAIPYLEKHWKMQDNRNDNLTDTIVYRAKTFDELLYLYNKDPRGNFNYLVHRWYNKRTSDMAENIFCSYNIAEKEKNFKHKTIDFYLMDTPFDLKVSSFPKRFGKQRTNYRSDREYRNDLIRWLYENQSKQRRNHEENRLFIVCKHNTGLNSRENLFLKMDFEQIHKKVNNFLQYSEAKLHKEGEPFNKVRLKNGKYVYSDVIFIN